MKNWINDYLTRCLEGVPKGSYRDRTEKELQDHLLALSRDLKEAGHSAEEVQSLAQARMGDPAELARRYVREWRRRTLGRRALVTGEVLLVGTVMVVMSYLYATNTHNFGKSWTADWAFVAIPAAVILLCGSLTGSWSLVRLSSWIITVIQLPPMFWWMIYLWDRFEMSGMMVYGPVGLGLHLLYFVWGMDNYRLAAQFQREEDFLSKAQSE